MEEKKRRPRKGGTPADTTIVDTHTPAVGLRCADCRGRRKKVGESFATFVHEDGCPVLVATEVARERDREFFAAHPWASEYYREAMPGDLSVTSLDCILATADGKPPRIRVRQIAEGVRSKAPTGNLPWFLDLMSFDGQRLALMMGDRHD
jgi:hypothetical protein